MRLNTFPLLALALTSPCCRVRGEGLVDDDDAPFAGTTLVGNTITRTDVSDLAAITIDLRDMSIFCEDGDPNGARAIYRDGKNAAYSLKELATKEQHLENDLTFAFQMYGLSGGKPEEAAKYRLFASEYVEQKFDEMNCFAAVFAAQHMILWMHTSFAIWNTVMSCAIAADPSFDNEAAGVDNMPAKADEIVAYWVGLIQDDAEGVEGYSLYSSTNEIAEAFGTDVTGGARANRNILYAYEVVSGILSSEEACTGKTKTIEQLWPYVTEISRQSLVPQIQWLIDSMVAEDLESIDLFARIVVPQVSQCRYSSYTYLKETFLDIKYETSKFHKTLKVLQSVYSCLGLTCLDIGLPYEKDDNGLGCVDDYDPPTIAGYPASTDVTEQSKIDLDMHQINVLTQFENVEYWQMAKYIYRDGKNSRLEDYYESDDDMADQSLRSLHSLAVSGSSAGVLYYNDFIKYFDDQNYADTQIFQALENEGRWKNKPMKQRAAAIRVVMQTQLMYMHVLTRLNDAVVACGVGSDNLRIADDGDGADAWDEAAAFIIGSLEGEAIGGAEDFGDGESLWSLGNNRGIEFGRQNEQRFATANDAIFNMLLAGKGMLEAGYCTHLGRFSFGITHMLLIPIIQSVVKYSIVNEFEQWSSGDEDIAAGESFANAIIPIFGHYHPVSASTMKTNMVMGTNNFEVLVVDGPQQVADTFLALADDFNIECEYIGKSFEVDACLNYVSTYKTSGSAKQASFAVVSALSAAATVISLLL